MVFGDLLTIPGIQDDVLWENASPGSSFGAQTINLPNLSYYDYVLIGLGDGSATLNQLIPNVPGNGAYVAKINGGSNGAAERRIAWIRDGKIEFTDVAAQGGVGYNDQIIPQYVRGIKF